MDLCQHLEGQIAEYYELLNEYEAKLRTEIDPRLKLKWEEEVEEVKQQICQREEELQSLQKEAEYQQQEEAKRRRQEKQLTYTTPTDETDDFSSEKGVDYTKLRDLLAAEKWKEADQETARVMLLAADTKRGYLVQEDIKKFPCADLRKIDQLWVKASNGRFGFSVQNRIWLEVGGQVDDETECKLGERVGWRVKGKWFEGWVWKWLDSNSVTFNLSAPVGHLPFIVYSRGFPNFGWGWRVIVVVLVGVLGGFGGGWLWVRYGWNWWGLGFVGLVWWVVWLWVYIAEGVEGFWGWMWVFGGWVWGCVLGFWVVPWLLFVLLSRWRWIGWGLLVGGLVGGLVGLVVGLWVRYGWIGVVVFGILLGSDIGVIWCRFRDTVLGGFKEGTREEEERKRLYPMRGMSVLLERLTHL